VAILGSFETCGLEEWISGSDTYLTTVKCRSAAAVLEDPALIELYMNYYALRVPDSEQAAPGVPGGVAGAPKTTRLVIPKAKVLKVEKERFLKAVAGRTNLALQHFALQKLQFQKERMNYLAKQVAGNTSLEPKEKPPPPGTYATYALHKGLQQKPDPTKLDLDVIVGPSFSSQSLLKEQQLQVQKFDNKQEAFVLKESADTKRERALKEQGNNALIAKYFKEYGIKEQPLIPATSGADLMHKSKSQQLLW
jgi:7,8-dihydro-6-hydroxymethylpterin-pyrophosphokinase